MQNVLAPVQFEITETLAKRKSIRAFDIQKPVLRSYIMSLLEAARWSPSCFNDEPWRFIVWDKNDNNEAYQKAFDCLGEWNQKWVRTAPVIIASFAVSKFREGDKDNRWAEYDTGAAANSICIQAASIGLQAHQMGGYSADKLKEVFNVPTDVTSMAMIAIGYPGDIEVLDESYHEGENKIRTRKPFETNFYKDTWDSSILA